MANEALALVAGTGVVAGKCVVDSAGTAGLADGTAAVTGVASGTSQGGAQVTVEWRKGKVVTVPGAGWTAGGNVWAAASGGFTQVDPANDAVADGTEDPAYVGVAISSDRLVLDLPHVRQALIA